MALAAEIVILLSVGSFQALLPQAPKATGTSPSFPDTAAGVTQFVQWVRPILGEPKFNQPPTRVCVVGAVPFSEGTVLYLPEPLWLSRQPLRQLEPYSASFHYVELPAPGAKAPAPRTLRDAGHLCAQEWKKKP
ncbi:MAG: hypothetical protein LW854_07065 [Rubrivivax sp.]|jgi:hypothetical protein|nr:hypothetical protein [Rubrivivax sp.]